MEALFKFFDNLNPILRNVLLVIAVLWLFKIILFFVFHFLKGFRVFILSRLFSVNLISRYGEVVIITGATDGVGLEFAKQFAERGHSIVVIGRNEEKLKNTTELVASLLKPGKRVAAIMADLNTDDPSVYYNIQTQLQPFKNKIGILINNAGFLLDKPGRYLELSEREIMQNVRVNMTAVLMITRMVLPLMLENKRGLIINMSSFAAIKPLPLTGVYAASKKFVEYFGAALSYEYKNDNIDVLTLVPSYIATKMVNWSNLLSKPSLAVPSAKRFVKSAISTIGHTNHTTGYMPHAIFWFFTKNFTPTWIYSITSAIFLTKVQSKTRF